MAGGISGPDYEDAFVAWQPEMHKLLVANHTDLIRQGLLNVPALGHAAHMALPLALSTIDTAADKEYLHWKHAYAGEHLTEFHHRCLDYTAGRRPLKEQTLWAVY